MGLKLAALRYGRCLNADESGVINSQYCDAGSKNQSFIRKTNHYISVLLPGFCLDAEDINQLSECDEKSASQEWQWNHRFATGKSTLISTIEIDGQSESVALTYDDEGSLSVEPVDPDSDNQEFSGYYTNPWIKSHNPW